MQKSAVAKKTGISNVEQVYIAEPALSPGQHECIHAWREEKQLGALASLSHRGGRCHQVHPSRQRRNTKNKLFTPFAADTQHRQQTFYIFNKQLESHTARARVALQVTSDGITETAFLAKSCVKKRHYRSSTVNGKTGPDLGLHQQSS